MNFACVLKSGGDFDWNDVIRLRNGITKHCSLPVHLYCMSDIDIPSTEDITVCPLVHDLQTWWSKLELFSLIGCFLYFDLDTVITSNIDKLCLAVQQLPPTAFVMRTNPYRNHLSSNIMAWKGDWSWLLDALLEDRKVNGARFVNYNNRIRMSLRKKRFNGDQDWIEYRLKQKPDVNVITAQSLQQGIYSYKLDILRRKYFPKDASIIVFHGAPRPHEVQPKPKWLADNYVLNEEDTKDKSKQAVKSRQLPPPMKFINKQRRDIRHASQKRRIKEWRPSRRKEFNSVPKLWNDETCYILGGGPSLDSEQVDKLNGKHVIAVNYAYKLAFFADVLFFGDCWWFEKQRKSLESFSGAIITTCEYEINTFNRVIHVRHKLNGFGLTTNRNSVYWNLNAGACAVNVAVHLGAKRIVLLGFDMRQIDGRNNWHADHRTSLDPSHNPYNEFLIAWPYIARDAAQQNIEVLNATQSSALRLFPFVDLDEILAKDVN